MACLMIARVNEVAGISQTRQELSLDSLPTAEKTHAFALPLCLIQHESDQEIHELIDVVTVAEEENSSEKELRIITSPKTSNETSECRGASKYEDIRNEEKQEQEYVFAKLSSDSEIERAQQRQPFSFILKEQPKAEPRSEKPLDRHEQPREISKKSFLSIKNKIAVKVKTEERSIRSPSSLLQPRVFFLGKSQFQHPSCKVPSFTMAPQKKEYSEKQLIKDPQVVLVSQRECAPTISRSPSLREREGREHGGGQQGHEQEQQPQKEKKRKIEKIERSPAILAVDRLFEPLVGTKQVETNSSKGHIFSQLENADFGYPTPYQGVPQLALPQVGPLALYYILTKMGILSDNLAQQGLQQEIEELDREISKSLQERIAEMKEVERKEKATKDWDIMTKVMSWITSFMAIFTGVVLIVTGAGAFAGAMAIVAGLISLTNHILEITGTWKTIAAKLAEDNPDKSRAIIMWMQIGIAIVSFVLLGASVVFGGLSPLKGAMGTAGGFTNAIAGAVIGVLLIGKGISEKFYHERMARLKEIEKKVALLKQQREDDLAQTEELHENSKKYWEELFEIMRTDNFDTREIHTISRGVG